VDSRRQQVQPPAPELAMEDHGQRPVGAGLLHCRIAGHLHRADRQGAHPASLIRPLSTPSTTGWVAEADRTAFTGLHPDWVMHARA
jgi:hypothetical protein